MFDLREAERACPMCKMINIRTATVFHGEEEQCPDCGGSGLVRYSFVEHRAGGPVMYYSNMSCHCGRAPTRPVHMRDGSTEDRKICIDYDPRRDNLKRERLIEYHLKKKVIDRRHTEEARALIEKSGTVSRQEYFDLMLDMERKWPGRGWKEQAHLYRRRMMGREEIAVPAEIEGAKKLGDVLRKDIAKVFPDAEEMPF
jgi:hypothetical protein